MSTLKYIWMISLGLILAAELASAQTGTVTGTVTDPSGAAIVGATVDAQNLATGTDTKLPSNEAGFVVLQLAPGDYKILATAPGFQPVLRPTVTVDALANVALQFQLPVGNATTEMTVDEAAVVVQTENATLGTTMRHDVYEALPLAMSQGVPRDPTSFIGLAPGVAAVVLQSAGTSYTSFNGAQQETNGLYFEGLPMFAPNQNGDTRPIALGVSVDAVNQFQVEVNGQKAQYVGQGFHNYVVKSGTNQLHGGLFEIFGNTAFDARGFFSPFVPTDHQHEFGGNIGGRIIKDKLFYFGNVDDYIFHTSTAPTVLTVPSLAERQGNFSALPITIYDPSSQTCTGAICTKTAFAGNIIQPSRLSKVSQSFASYLPNPTAPGFVNNYIQPLPRAITNTNTTEKFDYRVNEKNTLYGVFVYGQWKTDYTGNLTPTGTALPLPYTQTPGIVVERPWIMQIHDTHIFSPSLLNSFGIGMTRLSIPIFPVTAAGNYPQKAGLTGLPPVGQAATGFPGISFSGSNAPNNWAGTGPFNEWANDDVIQDTVQWVRRSHVMTFGGAYTQIQDNRGQPASGTSASFTFSNTETAGYSATGALQNSTGNAFASYMLGAVDSEAITNNLNFVEEGSRWKNFGLFAQDDWKVNSKLTVNIGLRWDVFFPFQEQHARSSYFVPTLPNPAVSNIAGALAYGGQPINTHWKHFQPRLGLAFQIDPKTVFRGGFVVTQTVGAGGIGGNGGGAYGITGLVAPTALSTSVTGLPAYYWDQGVVSPTSPYPLASPGFGAGNSTVNPAGAISPNYVDANLSGKSPYYINWSGGFERQMPAGFVLGATYSASVGHFLPRNGDLGIWTNSIQPKYLALGSLLNAQATAANVAATQAFFPEIKIPFSNFQGTIAAMLKPFPQYSGLTCFSCDLGNSTYNSVQITANRRMASGLTIQFAYTFSKEIDNMPNGGLLGTVGGTRNPFNGRPDRGLGAINHPNNLHLSTVYNLPFGRGHLGGKNQISRSIIGGWALSGIYTLASGAPLGITGSGCTTPGIIASGNAAVTCVPNYNSSFSGPIMTADWGSGNVLGAGATSYIYKNAFIDPAPYTFGNAARSAPYGLMAPTLWNLDANLRKQVAFRERFKFEFTADFFNIFNTVVFGAPGTNIDSANFGQLTTAANSPRRIQLAARIMF
jgi:hypothetical protein